MTWPEIDPQDALRRLRAGARAIDVRSPGEFATGSLPGYSNVPILNDEHRHQVGLAYKNEGSASAIALGHRQVDPLRPSLVAQWTSAISKESFVTCWRGGLRSQIAAEWLAAAGVSGSRVSGGYKAQRRILLSVIESPREWIVLEGLTGGGKSELLRGLNPDSILDLEHFARHRGSAFGGWPGQPQPAQQTFENAIGLHLFGLSGPVVVEDESVLIGSCSLPPALRIAIRESPRVRLRTPLAERVARIFAEYVEKSTDPHLERTFLTAVERIAKSLGGLRATALKESIRRAFASSEKTLDAHGPWIESLLKEYYDPRYAHGLAKTPRAPIFEGSYDEVRNFLTNTLDRRRT